jgi:heme oxygenase
VAIESIKLHIETRVRANPHLLIAYAWTLYLAVFSGGRYIRSNLCDAGEDFWLGRGTTSATHTQSAPAAEKKSSWNWRSPVGRLTLASSQASASTAKWKKPTSVDDLRAFEAKGLSLWFFPGPHDGEELRAEFKQNLYELEALLSVEQEMEIVAEAQAIFSRVEALVSELDTAFSAARAVAAPAADQPSEQQRLLDQTAAVEDDITTDQVIETVTEAMPVPVRQMQLAEQTERWFEISSFAGLALVVCGISYCALFYGGQWSG